MKNKYRMVVDKNKYMPQVKGLFFWSYLGHMDNNVANGYFTSWIRTTSGTFNYREKAESFAKDYKDSIAPKDKKRIEPLDL